MSLQFSVLASGSTGNAIYVATDTTSVLIDAGLSGKAIDQLFQQIDRKAVDLSAILVSHEHSDHIRGIGVLARKYGIPVYANEKTWKAMDPLIGTVDTGQKFDFATGTVKTIGNLDIESFAVSHDAEDPMFFTFHYGGRKLAVMTDTGYVSDKMKGVIHGAHSFVFESNHDVGMLQMGPYPWSIKRRILGDYGHVSNEDAAYAMADVITDETTRIYLAHLSQDNNMKDLARMSVTQTLAERGFIVGERFNLFDTDPKVPTPLTIV